MNVSGMLQEDKRGNIWIYCDAGDGTVGWRPLQNEQGKPASKTDLHFEVPRFPPEEDPAADFEMDELHERLTRIEDMVRQLLRISEYSKRKMFGRCWDDAFITEEFKEKYGDPNG